jgi:cytochrome P450
MRWQKVADAREVLNVSREMSSLALKIVFQCMFGQDWGEQDPDVWDAVQEAQEWISERIWPLAPDWTERLPTHANRRFRRALAALDNVVDHVIEKRLRATGHGNDLLGMLLTAQQEVGRMNSRQLRDEAMTMLLAGHETPATVLAWAWHLMQEFRC